jgi:hypothetical protein
MNVLSRVIDKVFNDEPETPFDYEPSDLDLVEPDTYTKPDLGDAESSMKPPQP